MMKRACLTQLMVSFVLVNVLSTISIAGDWVPFPVDYSTENQEKPDIFGTKIVWQQFVESDWDVYGVQLIEGIPVFFTIAKWIGSDQLNVSIWEDTVVWQDNYFDEDQTGPWAIYIADTNDIDNVLEASVAMIEGVNHEYPAISGNTVIWQEDSAGTDDIDIWGTDVTDVENIMHYEVAYLEQNQQSPAIYRDNVFWQDDQYYSSDILYADIWQKDNAPIYDLLWSDFDQENPSVWGNIIAWDENIDGDSQIIAADITDLDEPVKFTVCFADSLQQNPDVGDNLIVWEDYRNGNWDIYAYNLTTGHEFQITTSDADQRYPAVSGDIVVWQQDMGGNIWNIYAVELFGPEIARCESNLSADSNGDCQVNIIDLAIMATQWLTCNLDNQQLCWN